MPKLLIMVTGGSGMVGRNLLEHTSIDEFDVLAPSRADLDLFDFAALQAYLQANKPDIVVHAAGKVGGIQANIREPVDFLLANLDLGRNVVLASKRAGVKRLINLASSCIYPRNHAAPLTEDCMLKGELEPTNEGYALSKLVTARLCEYITREDPCYQYKTLIPCNLYGRYDKFDPGHSHLIPAIIHKIHLAKQCGQECVEIWGDGTARREFMYAGDLSDAIVRAIVNFDTLPNYMNVGLGYDHAINDYYHAAADVLGYLGSFRHNLDKPVGMARKLVSVELQKKWGWSASHELREGIRKTYEYYLKEMSK
jgi:GDP-L-fucose synthase